MLKSMADVASIAMEVQNGWGMSVRLFDENHVDFSAISASDEVIFKRHLEGVGGENNHTGILWHYRVVKQQILGIVQKS